MRYAVCVIVDDCEEFLGIGKINTLNAVYVVEANHPIEAIAKTMPFWDDDLPTYVDGIFEHEDIDIVDDFVTIPKDALFERCPSQEVPAFVQNADTNLGRDYWLQLNIAAKTFVIR